MHFEVLNEHPLLKKYIIQGQVIFSLSTLILVSERTYQVQLLFHFKLAQDFLHYNLKFEIDQRRTYHNHNFKSSTFSFIYLLFNAIKSKNVTRKICYIGVASNYFAKSNS